jgi:hypothetical protein
MMVKQAADFASFQFLSHAIEAGPENILVRRGT